MAKKSQRLLPKLLRAIHARDLDAARAALDEGADPNGTGGYNAKPLWTAAAIHADPAARAALTRLVLDRGADPNDPGPYGFDNRPIFYVAHCGYDAVARMLIDAGGMPRDAQGDHARNSDGATILGAASAGGLLWLMRRALDEGCRADDVDRLGSTALHYAAVAKTLDDGARKDTAAAVTALLDAGAPVGHQNDGDRGTALHWAVGYGDLDAVRALLAGGAELEASTASSLRPLHFGAQSGRGEAARAALEAGAQVDPRDSTGRTPLHHAALRVGHLSGAEVTEGVIRALLDHGADRRATDADGDTPHAIASRVLTPARRKAPPPTQAQTALLALLAP